MSTFADWARSGIGARATATAGAQRASVPVTAAWSVHDGARTSAESFTKTLPLVGPGDVVGIDPDQVAAVFPADGTLAAAPEELAFVEFHTADLPWRYTPGAATAGVALQPWVGLIVLPAPDPAGPVRELGEGRRSVQVPPGQRPTGVDWSLWAHVEGERSRLVAPRILEPNTRYVACVVPTFEAGRLAGLGQAPGTASGAWTTSPDPLPVPVYASWTFTTGPGGTFEQLARRLEPLERTARTGLGSRAVDTTTLGEPAQPSSPTQHHGVRRGARGRPRPPPCRRRPRRRAAHRRGAGPTRVRPLARRGRGALRARRDLAELARHLEPLPRAAGRRGSGGARRGAPPGGVHARGLGPGRGPAHRERPAALGAGRDRREHHDHGQADRTAGAVGALAGPRGSPGPGAPGSPGTR